MTRKSRSSGLFSLIVIAICMALSVTLADLFSSVLTVGFFSADSLSEQSLEIYAVSLLRTQSKIEAVEFSKTIQSQNGAGYVWSQNKEFYVFASAYEQENDAKLVKDNLKTQSVESEIIKLNFLSINFKEEYNNEERSELSNSTAIYKTTFKKLYDISVSFDTEIINEMQAKLEVGKILSDVTKSRTNFETRFATKKNSETVYLGVKYKDLLEATQNLSDSNLVSDMQTYSSLIKYTYIKILSIYSELIVELSV